MWGPTVSTKQTAGERCSNRRAPGLYQVAGAAAKPLPKSLVSVKLKLWRSNESFVADRLSNRTLIIGPICTFSLRFAQLSKIVVDSSLIMLAKRWLR